MNKSQPKVESLYDRQEILSQVAGFIAPSSRELSEALSIIGPNDGSSVNQHLQEIYKRQKYNQVEKPENAVKSVVKEYITYYRSSKTILRHLGYLATEISEICNPNISLGEEIKHINSSHRAFVSYVDLKDAYKEPDAIVLQRSALSRNYFQNTVATKNYVSDRLDEISVKNARKLVQESLQDQNNRSVFWHDALIQSKYNFIGGPIVKLALRNI